MKGTKNETRRAGLGFISYTGPCCVTHPSTRFLCFEECGNGPFFVGSLDFFFLSQNCSQLWLLQPEKDLLETTLIKTLRRGFLTALAFFSPLVLCRHCGLLGRRRKGRGKEENERRNWGEKKRDSPPCPFRDSLLLPSPPLPSPSPLFCTFHAGYHYVLRKTRKRLLILLPRKQTCTQSLIILRVLGLRDDWR